MPENADKNCPVCCGTGFYYTEGLGVSCSFCATEDSEGWAEVCGYE